MSTELPNRTVVSNIWSAGADDVVTVRNRFSEPARLSDEVSANRADHDDKRVLAWCCLASAAVAIAAGLWLTWMGGGF